MKISSVKKVLLLCMIFLLWTPLEHAVALTFLARTKDVRIDADWRITGQYTCEYEISQPDDIREINHILRQFQKQTDPSLKTITEVRLPDGRGITWEPDAEIKLPDGTLVRLTTMITRDFPGFAGLFADSMHIDQDEPIKTVTYRISFPENRAYTCRIIENHGSRQETDSGEAFTWSGDDITRLDIMLSTATSWEQITQRYQTHFQTRMGDGLLGHNLPEKLMNIDIHRSTDEKIREVMGFLKNDLSYQVSTEPGHTLLPDNPAAVLSRGWGDCKDFALLASALLRKMDIETFVVLKGTPRKRLPGNILPDPFMFDHALIGFCRNGETAYYDCLSPDNTATVNDQNVYLSLKVF